MRAPARAAALLLVLAASALAHNGEYIPPLPPPRVKKEPKDTPGVPQRPATTDGRGIVTPGTGARGTEPVAPGEVPRPSGPELGFGRDDDRLTVEMWWEANRHRFLPKLPELPLRTELVEILFDASLGESDTVRDRALIALGHIRDAAAFDRIKKSLGAQSVDMRASAVLALGLLGRVEASPLLKKVAANGEASLHLRAHAMIALGLIGAKEDRPFLREVLAEEWEGNIRSAAVLAAALHRDPEAVHILGRIMLRVHPVKTPETAETGDMRIGIGLRCLAARALGRVLTPKAYDYLIWAVDTAEPHVAAAAAIVLGSAEGTAGLPALRRAIAAGRPTQLRQYALIGLGERGDVPGITEAHRILRSPPERDGLLGPFAALALGLSRREEHLPRLQETLRDAGADTKTRAAAALAVGILGEGKVAGSLEKILATEKSPSVMGWGILADALLGGRNAHTLAIKVLEESDLPGPRRHAVTALGILARPETAEILVKELADSYHVNREAAVALARVDPKRGAAELARRLLDPNVNAGRHAAHSVGVLLAERQPGPIAEFLAGVNPLCGAPVMKACMHLTNEYLYSLVWDF